MRIEFLSDQQYETGGPGKGPTFATGQILDRDDIVSMSDGKATVEWAEAFLNRWVQRGVARSVPDDYTGPEKDEQPDADPVDPVPDLEKLTRAELDALAAERGVDVSAAKSKADVIAALAV